jgi:cellulose synthase/poly-beta-1,6-N-acetylglucosamine synthase-like glycosyltransferase
MELIKFVIYISIYIGLISTSFFILSFFAGKRKPKELFSDEELPFVSILIPAFNEEKSVAPTLDSILDIDYPKDKFEVVFVDDGSKDKTLKVAQAYEKKGVRVFHKENDPVGKKGSAMNFALKKARGEIVVSMDADTFVDRKSLKQMVRYFKNEEVMCVSPGITVYKPRNLLQRIQYMEYLMGLFLRKAFASVNAIHITPGAFSAYRKVFFDKYGGYEEGNLTEDLEVALRIQANHYIIENSPDSPVYTIAPSKFKELLIQRRRWYIGLMKNTWKYKKIFFNKEYGDLGMFVFPIAWISIFFSVFVTVYLFFKTLFQVSDEIQFLRSVHFDLGSLLDINVYFLERWVFLFVSNPVIVFIFFFVIIIGTYLIYAARMLGRVEGWYFNLPLFFMFFAILFGFWWTVSIIYAIFDRDVGWR